MGAHRDRNLNLKKKKSRGEGQVFEIDETEIRRDSQVENHVLRIPNRRCVN